MSNELSLSSYQEQTKRAATKYTDKEKELSNWGLGVAGEAGDLAGCIKKTLYHKNDQSTGIRENIGDVMWYLAMICNCMGWKMEEILQENLDKLDKRYPSGFNYEAASRKGTRVDWMEKS